MKNIFFVLISSTLILSVSCSMPSLSGTTSSENAKILGTVLTETGDRAPNAPVKLIPASYNPVSDSPIAGSLRDTTDNNGVYCFDHAGTGHYNILANDMHSNKNLIHTRIFLPEKDSIIVLADTLKNPGAIQCNFPSTVNRTGYVYIQGTELYAKLSDGIDIGNGQFAVYISCVPAGPVPRIQWVDLTEATLISDTTVVAALDTVVIEVIDTTKPVWRFSCIAGVTVKTAATFGGIDSVKLLIKEEIAQALKKFNNPGLLKGILDFRIDSIYQFDGDLNAEINKPLNGFDYRFLYYADTDDLIGSYTTNTRTICQVDRGPGLFGQFSIDALAWSMGMARGGIGLEWLVVKAKYNPVNNQDYAGITSFMNWPYGENTLDWYTAAVVNYYADSVYYGNNLVNRAFPKNIAITVRDTLGIPLANIPVTLYGIGWKTFTVDTPAVITSRTDSNGEFVISKNPFNPDDATTAQFLNFLVTAVNGSETAYTWLPVTDVVYTWLADPARVCHVQIQFKGYRNK